jgi:hypothetical protein
MPTETRTQKEQKVAIAAVQAQAEAAGLSVQDYLSALQDEKKGATAPQEGRNWPPQSKRKNGRKKRGANEPDGSTKKRAAQGEIASKSAKRPNLEEEGVPEFEEGDDRGRDPNYAYSSCDDDEDTESVFDAQFAKKKPLIAKPKFTDAELVLQLMAQGQPKEAKKKMLVAIKKVVRTQLFRYKKFVDDDSDRKLACEIVLMCLKFKDMDDRATAEWIETYGSYVVTCVNAARGYVQSGIKKVMYNRWSTKGKKAFDIKLLPLLLKRELDMENPQHYEVMKLWVTEILPKCCGFAGGWDEKKYYYITISQDFNPDNPIEMSVTPSTEAIGAWFIENNEKAWPAQWAVKENYPGLKMEKHIKHPDKDEVVPANKSFVSPLCPVFLLHWTFDSLLCRLFFYLLGERGQDGQENPCLWPEVFCQVDRCFGRSGIIYWGHSGGHNSLFRTPGIGQRGAHRGRIES